MKIKGLGLIPISLDNLLYHLVPNLPRLLAPTVLLRPPGFQNPRVLEQCEFRPRRLILLVALRGVLG